MSADRIDAMEAGPDADESQRVRVARALYEADMDPEEFWTVKWESAYALHDKYLRLADAALAVRLTSMHNHTRFRNDDGPWGPCPASCPAGDPAAAAAAARERRWASETAWFEGYEACRRGDQRRNPYRAALAQPAPATDETGASHADR